MEAGVFPPVVGQVGEGEWRDFVALLKPRVVSLVVFTGAIGVLIAPGHINPIVAFIAILCIAIGAGAAGCLNMWWERDIDAKMHRTASRPIPQGRIDPNQALGFGVLLAAMSVILLALATNVVAAGLLIASILFYVVIYTMWLKRRTAQNIVIGGAAGAFPVLIGWAAVTGSVAPLPILLFALVFAWTPPHFWALSLYACQDYARAGVPMLPVVAGARSTRRHVFGYTLLLGVVAVLPWALGLAGAIYGVTAAVMSAGFLLCSARVVLDRTDSAGVSLTNDAAARAAFRFSLVYLAVLFVAIGIDRVVAR